MINKSYELKIWQCKLLDIYTEVQNLLQEGFSIRLDMPNIEISPDLNCTLGEWIPERRMIRFAEKLFYSQPFSIISEIFKHEIAHQIVTEIFHADIPGVSHGEAFSKACKMLNISPERTFDEKKWLQSQTLDPVVDKIGKIINKANCTSATEKEAEIFLQKAQELMVKYNLSQCQLNSTERNFVTRPASKLYKKMPNYLYAITNLLSEHYFVKSIKSYIEVESFGYYGPEIKYKYYMELFGEPSNVEIATYIFDVLLHQCENLWETFKKNMKKAGLPIRGLFTKGSYIRGVIEGYNNKLGIQKMSLSNKNNEYYSLISLSDPLLEEMYYKEYPRIKRVAVKQKRDAGYSQGFIEGQSLNISTPISHAHNNGLLLGNGG